mmetsp:Transcript_30037/g.35686  ORF Transcript_30037/g.35686 Transcript_30037/m.35686 type:complete len:413 (-) Transcript_30037:121-1359(-)
MVGEETPLTGNTVKISDAASSMSGKVGITIAAVQVIFAVFLSLFFSYADVGEYTTEKYIIFRDIMVMLLLGFGYLMTFLHLYGLGAVGLTILLTVVNMQCNIMVEGLLTSDFQISMDSLINAEFSAATLLISFGALIGRATPFQMCVLAIAESVFYAMNKVIIVFGVIGAEDVGGTLTIHMFGAFFGLAAAKALGSQQKEATNNEASRVSDVVAFIGTTLLWVYWPSFVGATESGSEVNEMHCLVNTILALLGSTGAAFFMSQHLSGGKFDPVHIQNSTLAGGVAIGASARLAIGPGAAFIVGLVAGTISVLGYHHSSPYLETAFGIYDTCGVGNLHGYPSVIGGLASILFVAIDSDAEFLTYGYGTQSAIQLIAVVATFVMAKTSGFISGKLILNNVGKHADYDDNVWWVV